MPLQTPGIYLRHTAVPRVGSKAPIVAGFVGQAQQGPVNLPRRLTSWEQYRAVFGEIAGPGFLGFAVRGFFQNGGEACYVVRVVDEKAWPAHAPFSLDGSSTPRLTFTAVDPGEWGNAIRVRIEQSPEANLFLAELDSPLPSGATSALLVGEPDFIIRPNTLKTPYHVSLIHPSEPIRQDRIPVLECGVAATRRTLNHIRFKERAEHLFPAHTRVMGHGFRLTIRYRQGGFERTERFEDLSLDPKHERYWCEVINGDEDGRDHGRLREMGASLLVRGQDHRSDPGLPSVPAALRQSFHLRGGSDGNRDLDLSYYTGYRNNRLFVPVDSGHMGARGQSGYGLARLAGVEEVNLVAIPDLVLPGFRPEPQAPDADEILGRSNHNKGKVHDLERGQAQILRHCSEVGDRFAILDAPPTQPGQDGIGNTQDQAVKFHALEEARNGALYFPWLRFRHPGNSLKMVSVPPCGHVAGIYARLAGPFGLTRSPANARVLGVESLAATIGEGAQALLNPLGVNCLRSFTGRGIRVWGARTLSPDLHWRYISARHAFLNLRRLIRARLRGTVFEPNGPALWDRMTGILTMLCRELFANGGLAGNRMEEAFFVQCDAETNPPEWVAAGRVCARIGFAPTLPAEFLLINITRTTGGLSIREA